MAPRRVEPGVLAGTAAMALIGAWAAVEAWSYGLWRARSPGEGLYPFIVALAVLVLATASLVQAAAGIGSSPASIGQDEVQDDTGPPQWRKIGVYLAGLAALAAFLPIVGYWIVTAAVLMLILRGAERLSWFLSAAVTAAASLVTYLVFERLLGLPLPAATLF